MSEFEDEANGAGGVARQPVVMDFTKPRAVADFMQPPAGGWAGAGSEPDGGDYWESRGLEAPVGLWAVKGEDLTLRPGVPALVTNPAARPFSKAAIRQAANWGVSNAGEFVATARRVVAPDGGEPAENIADASAPTPVVAVEDKPEGAQEQEEQEVVPPAPGALSGESFAQAPAPPQGAPKPPEQTNDGTPPPTGQSGDAGGNAKEPKPYTISADGKSVSYGPKPYDGMMAAWKDGVIAQPGIEQWHAARVAQEVEEAKAGNKLYRVDDQGRLSFDPRHAVAGLDQAMGDGVVDGGSAWTLREELYNHPGHGMDAQREAMFAAMSGPELRAAEREGELSPQDKQAVIKMQQEAARRKADGPQDRDNGVGAWQDFLWRAGAKNAELLNRGAEGVAQFLGADGLGEWFQTNAEGMREIGQGKDGYANPAMNDSVHAAVADGVGTLLATTPTMLLSEVVGPAKAVGWLAKAWKIAIQSVPMATQFAVIAWAQARDEALKGGADQEKAEEAGRNAALHSLEALPVYMASGAIAGKAEKAILGELANPLLKAATRWLMQGGGNMAGSAAVRAMDGQPLLPTRDEMIQDLVMAAPGGLHAWDEARIAVAKKMVAGTHPDVQAYDAVAGSSDPKITDTQRAYAANQAEEMRGRAAGLLKAVGIEPRATIETRQSEELKVAGNAKTSAKQSGSENEVSNTKQRKADILIADGEFPSIVRAESNSARFQSGAAITGQLPEIKLGMGDYKQAASSRAAANDIALHFTQARPLVTQENNNILELTDKLDENTQDYERAIQPASANLSRRTGKQSGAGVVTAVERQFFTHAGRNSEGDGERWDAGTAGDQQRESQSGGDFLGNARVDAESTKRQISRFLVAFQKGIVGSGVKDIFSDSDRYPNNALVYEFDKQIIHINLAQVQIELQKIANRGKNPVGWLAAALREELAHHEIHSDLIKRGINPYSYYSKVYEELNPEQKVTLESIYYLPTKRTVNGREFAISTAEKQMLYGCEWLRLKRMLDNGEKWAEEYCKPKMLIDKLKMEMRRAH